nr:hypothetical protein [Tanacetum cinerariifolium]
KPAETPPPSAAAAGVPRRGQWVHSSGYSYSRLLDLGPRQAGLVEIEVAAEKPQHDARRQQNTENQHVGTPRHRAAAAQTPQNATRGRQRSGWAPPPAPPPHLSDRAQKTAGAVPKYPQTAAPAGSRSVPPRQPPGYLGASKYGRRAARKMARQAPKKQ